MGEREELKVTSGFGDSGCVGTNRGGGRGRKERGEFSLSVRFLGATQICSRTHRRYGFGTSEQMDYRLLKS